MQVRKLSLDHAKRKTKYVEVVYWDCGISDHCHRSEEVATRCISSNKKLLKILPKDISRGREIYAATEVVKGRTYKSVGEELHVSQTRVMQYVHRVFRVSGMGILNLEHKLKISNKVAEMRKESAHHLYLIECVAKHWGIPKGGVPYVRKAGLNHNEVEINVDGNQSRSNDPL